VQTKEAFSFQNFAKAQNILFLKLCVPNYGEEMEDGPSKVERPH
jgi:hypothetical protein